MLFQLHFNAAKISNLYVFEQSRKVLRVSLSELDRIYSQFIVMNCLTSIYLLVCSTPSHPQVQHYSYRDKIAGSDRWRWQPGIQNTNSLSHIVRHTSLQNSSYSLPYSHHSVSYWCKRVLLKRDSSRQLTECMHSPSKDNILEDR